MHLLFDLDGTLIDSRPGIIGSIRRALAANELPIPEPTELNWCIGPPLLETFKILLGADHADRFDACVKSYREFYAADGIHDCQIYPGIVATLQQLLELGHTLHVATSKVSVFAQPMVEHLQLTRYFASVDGSELDGTRADKTALIAHILDRESIATADAIMIGDRQHDMHGACNNQVAAIGVRWGYGSEPELRSAGAHRIAAAPGDLPALIAHMTMLNQSHP
jgi:phosphoglycolate phosphatase